jgi:hypothetical protein
MCSEAKCDTGVMVGNITRAASFGAAMPFITQKRGIVPCIIEIVRRQKGMAIMPFLPHKEVMTFSSDELILALVSLVRATRPGMLRQEADGFSVDFEAIARSKTPGSADRLLLKIGAVMGNSTPYPAKNPQSTVSIDLDAAEARQIADALAKLELVQAWPQDVIDMSRALRVRLGWDAGQASREN